MSIYNPIPLDRLHLLGNELLRIVDEGGKASVEEVCAAAEKRRIVEFISTHFGFEIQGIIKSPENLDGIDDFFANAVREDSAYNRKVNHNGLHYLLLLIMDAFMQASLEDVVEEEIEEIVE